MCGIAGKVVLKGNPLAPEILQKMAQALAHRGPDDHGIYLNQPKNVGLVHRRLAIIDLSPTGHQPMSDNEGQIWITFNGEIYNYQELRTALIEKGYPLRSQSDTEVIIYLYQEYGEKCLQYLRGMFAFAVYDQVKQKLFLARDRLGKKPLKYFFDGQTFIFASELKAILMNSEVPRDIDLEAIDLYLSLNYVPSPLTGFSHIRKLPPAHYLVLENGHLKCQRYWSLAYQPTLKISEAEAVTEIRSRLEEAVKIRLFSDVPLGAFLSGGIDSSIIVGLMAQNSSQAIKTFSIGFDYESHNELKYARQIAQRFQTDHTEYIVAANTAEILPKLVGSYEEPYADSSALPTYHLAQMTRQKVTVALSGDGGDENFAGYSLFPILKILCAHQKIPHHLRRYLFRSIIQILDHVSSSEITRRLKKANELTFQSDFVKFFELLAYFYFPPQEKTQIYQPDFPRSETWSNLAKHLLPQDFLVPNPRISKSLNYFLNLSTTSLLPDDFLVKVDIASMANSLEVRAPFLDHQFMEFVARLPERFKLKGRQKKYILKRAFANFLPPELISRKKMGFCIPIDEWFRTTLKNFSREILLAKNARLHVFIRPDYVQKLIKEHQNSSRNHGQRIWNLLCLELWLQQVSSHRP